MATSSGLPSPVGGTLVQRTDATPDLQALASLPRLTVSKETLIDAEQIATGVFSPATGFMTWEEVNEVLDHYTLGGTDRPWALPIVLQISEEEAKGLEVGASITLAESESVRPKALLEIRDLYRPDLGALCKRWFETDSTEHPGVAAVMAGGPVFIGGPITLFPTQAVASPFQSLILTPAQVREEFTRQGWSTVTAFHTRNVPHRGHEHIHRTIMDRHDMDGLFIHPVIGRKKPKDYQTDIIIKAYRTLIDIHYPKGRVFFSAFNTFSRYAGPREAIFTALCRRNFGCSHFVIGRDHTGVGDFYPSDAAHRLLDRLGSIGIDPIIFSEVAYNHVEECYEELSPEECLQPEIIRLSATKARNLIVKGEHPPEYLMRRDLVNAILAAQERGHLIFVP
ncbi:MAG: sulfate adenylyltransferase [Magnetococcales bacterium]|nr:sulfate adenylyltransferase [Magnetococcales bacterium]